MDPDDFESVSEDGAVTAEISVEGVVRVPLVPRKSMLVIQVEVFESMLTAMYGRGRSDEAEWTTRDRN